ncbi:MAG: hypothetical protein JJU12_01255 [Chlamydiales bacterium]|nr:hypothetical protein [Chlamydiales bacterium]
MKIRSDDSTPGLGFTGIALSKTSLEKVQEAVRFALDCLIMVWYLIEHAYYWLTVDASGSESVFKGLTLCKTHNYAKLSELWGYVHLRRNPQSLTQETSGFLKEHGLSLNETIRLEPHSDGFCQGAVMCFCKEWFKNKEEIAQVADFMKDGVPIEGAIYQLKYRKLHKAASLNTDPDFNAIPELASYQLAELMAVKLLYNTSPDQVLQMVETLPPGAYHLTIPIFNSKGDIEANHATAFIIQEKGCCYFYDPNYCIAFYHRCEIKETIQRIFKQYTGLDYSQNPQGSSDGFWSKISNFFNEYPNPPSTPLSSGFDLFRVTPQK